MEYDFYKIGERIRHERKKVRKISQDSFIAQLKEHGVSIGRNRLSSIENGCQKDFDLAFMLAVCDIFGWDMGFLMGEYAETTQDKHFICEHVGLSEYALDILCKNNDVISTIITQEEFSELAYKLRQLTDFESINKLEAKHTVEHISTKLNGKKSVFAHTDDALKFRIDTLFRRIIDKIEEAGINGKA